MSLYAKAGDFRVRATLDARRASCEECGAPMIAKTGDVVMWHWAHESANPHCSSSGESEWHLAWKATGLDGTQEVVRGNRRADVLAPGGFAVEFQRSALTFSEVRERESDWGNQVVWVFDAREARERRQECANSHDYRPCHCGIWLPPHPDKGRDDAYRKIRWARAPERVRAATCQVILDLDGEKMIYVGKWWEDSSPLRGYGWLVSRRWVIDNVVRGRQIPRVPNGRTIKLSDVMTT